MNRLVNILTSEARLREFLHIRCIYIIVYIYNVWLDCGKTIGFITPYRLSKVDSFQTGSKVSTFEPLKFVVAPPGPPWVPPKTIAT